MKMTMKQINRYLFPLLILVAVFLAFNRPKTFTKEQRLIIRQSDSVMYVTVWPEDSAILRTPCVDFTKAEPQVGIGKRIIWLQRLDKEGGPFECYLNVRIDSLFGSIGKGPEGCLSVPPMRGLVPRYTDVIVSYVHPETLKPQKDTVHGYTAVIFQHECDHLDGRLYIDRADTVYVSTSWEAERRAYDYSKPDWWPLQ